MAKLNQIIRAFEADELQMLNDVIDKREKQALADGYILSEPFNEIKEAIQLANKFVNGWKRETA